MKIHLTPVNIWGRTQFSDEENRIVASKIDDKWYCSVDKIPFDAGFVNIQSMTDFIEGLDQYEESLAMLGYHREGNVFISRIDNRFKSEIRVLDDGLFEVDATFEENGRKIHRTFVSESFDLAGEYAANLLDRAEVDIFSSIIIASKEDVEKALYVIEAKMSSKDLAKNLVRVKSSNIWSYGINIRDKKDRTGNVLVQFKDAHGGAGDIYEYFDVPKTLWKKFVAAPSKGHFLWKFIRNNFGYKKLTGDKRGKLPNAIN